MVVSKAPPHQRPFETFLIVLLVLILTLASLSRLLTYRFSLPYIDNPDEPTLYLKAQEWRGLFDLQGHARGYPPAIVALNYITQTGLEKLGQKGASPTIGVLRFISAIVNIVTLALVMASAYVVGGLFAAVVAGIVWAASSTLLEDGVYALADPWIYMFAVLALWLALVSVYDEWRRSWSVWSGVAGLVAVLFKYPALALLSVSGVAILFQLWLDPRRGRRYLLTMIALGGITAFYLLFIYRIGRFVNRDTPVATETRENGLINLMNWDRISNNLYYAIWPLNINLFAAICLVGALALVVTWRRRMPGVRLMGIVLVVVAIVSIPWLSAMFSLVNPGHRLRDVLPATTVACILFGVAAAQVAYLVRTKYLRQLLQIGLLLLAVFAYRSELEKSWRVIEDRRLPDWRVDARAWADAVLDPGTVLVDRVNEKTFNPYWGNSEVQKWFSWWRTDTIPSILEYSVDEWRDERGMSYALFSLSTCNGLSETPEGQSFLDQLLLLREFKAPPKKRGPEMAFYRLWRMNVEERILFGDGISLLGYDRSAEEVRPGGKIQLRFYWQASTPPQTNYSLFVHLTPMSDITILSQIDGAPGVETRPTMLWTEPSETIISHLFELQIPPDLEPGPYQIRIGLYDYVSFARLPILDEQGHIQGDSFPLMILTVQDSTSATNHNGQGSGE
jgi:hypothetical protein